MRAFAEATTDYQRLLRTVAERIANLTGEGCVLVLVSEDEQSLSAGAIYFEDPTLSAYAERMFMGRIVRVRSPGLAERVIQTRQCVIVPNADAEALRALLSPESAEIALQ